ncbi:MAG: hypothetical protein KDD56_04515 [Bdellovibrionales bacterium]|nr:hypothetical protein [Bdellovibrionales bacterium]
MNGINKELLGILVCPETHQPVTLAEEPIVSKINQEIDSGTLKNRAGELIVEKIDAGLIRQDKTILFPIRSGIPVMMMDEAIKID